MTPKVKGLFKGLKYISQIFVYKEHEMEIGLPTDVRHIAHIGFDRDSIHAPSWMNQFKSASDITPASLNGFTSTCLNVSDQPMETSWFSHDYKQPRRCQSISSSGNTMESSCPEIPKPSKKKKRKKVQVPSPVTLIYSSTPSFPSASKEEYVETQSHLPITYEEVIPGMPDQLQPVINEPLCV